MFRTPDLLHCSSAFLKECVYCIDIGMREIKNVRSKHIVLHFSREDLCNTFHIAAVTNP